MPVDVYNTIQQVVNVITTYHVVDIAIGVFLIACFLIGLAKRTWFNLIHIVTFFILFIICWFLINPLVLNKFVGDDLLNVIGVKLPENIPIVRETTMTPDQLEKAGLGDLINQIFRTIPEGALNTTNGTITYSISFNIQLENNSIRELLEKLIEISPFRGEYVSKEFASAVANIMINAVCWTGLTIALLIVTPILSLIIFLIFRATLFKKIKIKWNSRILGAFLGLVVPIFCIFIFMQSLGVYSETLKYLTETLKVAVKEQSIKTLLEQYGVIIPPEVFDEILKLNPKNISFLFGWMAGQGGIFGNVTTDTGEVLKAGAAVNRYVGAAFNSLSFYDEEGVLHFQFNIPNILKATLNGDQIEYQGLDVKITAQGFSVIVDSEKIMGEPEIKEQYESVINEVNDYIFHEDSGKFIEGAQEFIAEFLPEGIEEFTEETLKDPEVVSEILTNLMNNPADLLQNLDKLGYTNEDLSNLINQFLNGEGVLPTPVVPSELHLILGQ